ncbi:MAG: hypothetical protein JOZ90_11850 [Alphaproteobacteria bacterium]|nr:hypothetical protein [Alphaproteobacteria bacterium]MBV9901780.1 hypothetical protein [Alphaproteobacteria bacterium]
MKSPVAAAPTRRHLLVAAGLGLAGGCAGTASAAKLVAGGDEAPTAPLFLQSASAEEWRAAVGRTFTVRESGARLRLAGVETLPAPGGRPSGLDRPQAFAATFEAVAGTLPQRDGLYRLSHWLHAPLHVHLGAPDRAGGRVRLVAIFN